MKPEAPLEEYIVAIDTYYIFLTLTTYDFTFSC